ncbi:DHA2 family efflux MFS transporter permease subunit [Leuconostoc sp. C2]|uniref:DHA2 family efflux MFS transporter permease subunit n=1 Tax=Leuconostoc sp. (strain C2) TaxID=979982 RepID=UPI0002175862|nr:DHA2 family efflux MFS transporter permease subunit [Leuconostoc sp. C2]AEJ30726.1 drug:H+ antiporter-2 (DHA2) family protein [Leuconostoc sp. C2]
MHTNHWKVIPAVIASGILSFSGVLIETAMNVTFPTLMTEFNTNANGVQWVTTGYLLAIAIIVPISSFLIRNFSTRQLFIVSNMLFLVGIILNSLSPSLTILLLGRVLQGIGTGIALPLMFHIILTQSPIKSRGMMMGIGSMITSLAPAIGPTYGGILLNTLGWRTIFWFLIILVLISLIIGLMSIPNETVSRNEKFPINTFAFLAIGLSLSLLAVEKLSPIMLVLGIVSLVAFYIANKKQALLHLTLFKNLNFKLYMYSFLVYQAILLGLSFILPNYLQIQLHVSASAAGIFMFPGALIGAILAPISGSLLDHFGQFRPVVIGLIISTIALILMVSYFQQLNFWTLMFMHMLLMVGIGFSYANLMTVTLATLPPSQTADGNGILNTTQQFVGASATAIVAQLITTAVHASPETGMIVGAQKGIGGLTLLIVLSLMLFVGAHFYNKKVG